MSEKPSARRLFSFISNPKPLNPTPMFTESLRISRAKSSEKESIRAKKLVFPREIGPLWRKRFFDPSIFRRKRGASRWKEFEKPAKTRRKRQSATQRNWIVSVKKFFRDANRFHPNYPSDP
jgi:hypothetical protein